MHFAHRLGALVTTVVLATLALLAIQRAQAAQLRLAGIALLAALALQVAVGITTVVRGFPLALATAHNAGAALLLLSLVAADPLPAGRLMRQHADIEPTTAPVSTGVRVCAITASSPSQKSSR